MKIVKIVMLVLMCILILVGISLFVLIKNFDINRYKVQIMQAASDALGTEVSIGEITYSFSLNNGLRLSVRDLLIDNFEGFDHDFLMEVKRVHLSLDVKTLLVQRKLSITEVAINSPAIYLSKNEKDQWNIQYLGQTQKDHLLTRNSSPTLSGKKPEKEKKGYDDLGFFIRSFKVTDGKIFLKDIFPDTENMLTLTDAAVQIKDFSLDEPFSVVLELACLSEAPNVFLDGDVVINAQNKEVRFQSFKVKTDLSRIRIKELNDFLPRSQSLPFTENPRGQLVIDLGDLRLNEKGIKFFDIKGQLIDGKASVAYFPYPIDNIDLRFSLTESELTLNQLFMHLVSGKVNISAHVNDYASSQEGTFLVSLEELQVNELISKEDIPVEFEGKAFGKLDGRFSGLSESALRQTLSGGGEADVREARLIDVNLLRLVLSRISVIPDLVERIEANLPQQYKDKLNQKDTVFEKIETGLLIREGKLIFTNTFLEADGFLLAANGEIDFDQNIHLNANVLIAKDLSQSMVAAVEEIGYLMDEHAQIHIPFKPYYGPISRFKMFPDIKNLGKNIIKNRGKEELKRVIFKALDIEEDNVQPQPDQEATSSPETAEPPREVRPEEVLIENILNSIFD